MEKRDTIVSLPVGTWNDGLEHSVDKNYFAARIRFFPAVQRQYLQVLTEVLGELMWINVEKHWVTPVLGINQPSQ